MGRYMSTPFSREEAESLRAGDCVYLTDTIYSARDTAYERMQETLDRGEGLSFDLKDNVAYCFGPTPTREGRPIGSAGPTILSQMDKYMPTLLDLGLHEMVGEEKGSPEVIEVIIRNKSVYFAAAGGTGAVLSKRVPSSKMITHDDLRTKAIYKMQVKDLPVIVVVNTKGNNLYEITVLEYQK